MLETPLVNPDKAIRFPELNGTFKSSEPGEMSSWLHVGSAGKEFPAGFHKLVWVVEPEGEPIPLVLYGFFEKIEDSYFLHIPRSKPSGESKKQERFQPLHFQQFPDGWDTGNVDKYLLVRFSGSNEAIVVEFLDADYIISQIESKSLKGEIETDKTDPENETWNTKTAIITAKPAVMRDYLQSDSSGKLYGKKGIGFKRVK